MIEHAQHVMLGAIATAMLVVFGCSGAAEYELVGSNVTVGTDGKLEIAEIEGGNYMVTMNLEHLPPANRLGEGLGYYVMWLHPAGGQVSRAAVLEYDEGERTATGLATTTEVCFDVLVTAEGQREVVYPSYVEIVRQQHCPQ